MTALARGSITSMTSGGVNKLEIYRRFRVPEVWIWRGNKLHIFALGPDCARYDPLPHSRLLSDLDLQLIERCVPIRSWQLARQTFRAALSKKSED
jgi:Uma2 family endonuclease